LVAAARPRWESETHFLIIARPHRESRPLVAYHGLLAPNAEWRAAVFMSSLVFEVGRLAARQG
jgi:hypothetical protein